LTVFDTSSKTLGYIICGVAGLAGASACLYATDHRSSYLITAVVAAVLAVAIIGGIAITTRRRGNNRTQSATAKDDTTS
jgi:hypothetical protein